MRELSTPTLILGYGNVDRQDDGVAWHILKMVSDSLGRSLPEEPGEDLPLEGPFPHLFFSLQLFPELAETIARYEQVCFIDAHTENIPDEVQIIELKAGYQSSPFTHHLTAQTCLSLAGLYGKTPEAILVSVRGYSFGFSNDLSERTRVLTVSAHDAAMNWLVKIDRSK